MLLNLDGSFKQAFKKFEEGKLKVTGLHDYGDRVIIVLMPPRTIKSRDITVIDGTSHPYQPEDIAESLGTSRTEKIPTIKAKKKEYKKDKKGRIVREDGMVLCRYCGRPCTSKGCTRHETKCSQKPQSSLRARRKQNSAQTGIQMGNE